MNTVIISGNLGKNATIYTSNTGYTIFNFSVAVQDGFGENKKTVWYDCKKITKNKDFFEQNLTKGAKVFINGKGENENWTTETNEKRSKLVIIANEIEFSDIKTSNNVSKNEASNQKQVDNYDSKIEYSKDIDPAEASGFAPGTVVNSDTNDFDDDIPF